VEDFSLMLGGPSKGVHPRGPRLPSPDPHSRSSQMSHWTTSRAPDVLKSVSAGTRASAGGDKTMFHVEHSSTGDENRQAPVGIPRFSSLYSSHLFCSHGDRCHRGFGTIFPESNLGRIARFEKPLVADRE